MPLRFPGVDMDVMPASPPVRRGMWVARGVLAQISREKYGTVQAPARAHEAEEKGMGFTRCFNSTL